jgi:hypothetical protein
MTNAFSAITAEAARMSLEAVEKPKVDTSFMNMVVDRFPWELVIMMFWLVVLGVILHGIIAGIKRNRKGLSTASLSRRNLVVSTVVLFLGSGSIMLNLASRIGDLFYYKLSPKFLMVCAAEDVSWSLYFLAINTILAGIGFVVAILQKDKEPEKYKMLEEQQETTR